MFANLAIQGTPHCILSLTDCQTLSLVAIPGFLEFFWQTRCPHHFETMQSFWGTYQGGFFFRGIMPLDVQFHHLTGSIFIQLSSYSGFLKWGVSPSHPFLDGIFPNKNYPFLGTPFMEPPIYTVWKISHASFKPKYVAFPVKNWLRFLPNEVYYGGFLSHGGAPSHHPFLDGIFHYKPIINHPFGGTPIYGNP